MSPPGACHPVPLDGYPGKLREGFCDIEVTQGADLEECHLILDSIRLCLSFAHLTLVGKVETVAHENLGDTRGVLQDKTCVAIYNENFVVECGKGTDHACSKAVMEISRLVATFF